jgi:hypothetical protein
VDEARSFVEALLDGVAAPASDEVVESQSSPGGKKKSPRLKGKTGG